MWLAVAAAGGKALGGILADRFGWVRVAMIALLSSVPMIMFGAGAAYLAVVGMFLFQMTMAVTLAAVARLFPGQPSLAFGLPCLALIIGAMPVFVGLGPWFSKPWVSGVLLTLSAAALFKGLSGLRSMLTPSSSRQRSEGLAPLV